MRGRSFPLALAGALTLSLAAGCEEPGLQHANHEGRAHAQERRESQRDRLMDDIGSAIAVMHPTQGNEVRGTVRFVQEGNRVHVIAELSGLAVDTRHGFHIHEFGDCSAPDAASAGGHFNPEDHPHAMPPVRPRHAGDMGNIPVGRDGRARVDQRFDTFSIAGERNPALGRALIVHAQADTGRGDTGEAGARVACGVIGVAAPQR